MYLIGRRFDDSVIQEKMKSWPFKVINCQGKLKIQISLNGNSISFYPEEICAMILKNKKNLADNFLFREVEKVKDVVITVPAHFNHVQQIATKDAAKMAGLNVLKLINEPFAAALAYRLDKNNVVGKVLVFHLSQITLEVSILSVNETNFELKGNSSLNIGGEDFTNNMIAHFTEEIEKKINKSLKNNLRVRARLQRECEQLKRMLSSTISTNIFIEDPQECIEFESQISRVRFERLNDELFCKTIRCVKNALTVSNSAKEDIDKIVLVGGSTRIPKIQELLKILFDGKELLNSICPEKVVAYGATIQAAILKGIR